MEQRKAHFLGVNIAQWGMFVSTVFGVTWAVAVYAHQVNDNTKDVSEIKEDVKEIQKAIIEMKQHSSEIQLNLYKEFSKQNKEAEQRILDEIKRLHR